MKRFLDTLYDEKLDLESWVQETEVIRVDPTDTSLQHAHSFSKFPTPTEDEIIKTQEIEVANIQIFKDLAPLSRAIK